MRIAMENKWGTPQHAVTKYFCKGTPIHLVLLIQVNVTQLVVMEFDDKFPQAYREALSTLDKQGLVSP